MTKPDDRYIVRVPLRRSWFRAMRARDMDEPHRVATNLELLFDLTFVVAVAVAAAELGHSMADADLGHGITSYLSVFFAIWWAWMNFTWFASAFDCDDAFYRVLTLIQMAGVLVVAAGVADAFEKTDFTTITVGYVIMRVALVVQWLRAAASDERYRDTSLRYATGILVVQVGWVARLWLPEDLATSSFLALVLAEMSVPLLAERGNMTPWHPHHVSERYGLFTIIVLGESVTASSNAMSTFLAVGGVTTNLVLLSAGGLLLLFGMWWLYFLPATGEALAAKRHLSFVWGYSHFLVAASVAAVGAALEAAADYTVHHLSPVGESTVEGSTEVSGTAAALAVAGAVSVFLIMTGFVHGKLTDDHVPRLPHAFAASVCLVVVATVLGRHSVPSAVLADGLVVAGLVIFATVMGPRQTNAHSAWAGN